MFSQLYPRQALEWAKWVMLDYAAGENLASRWASSKLVRHPVDAGDNSETKTLVWVPYERDT